MSPKKMGKGERWFHRGRTRDELTMLLVWFSGFAVTEYLIGNLPGHGRDLFSSLVAAFLASIFIYFAIGLHWGRRTEEYLKQNQSGLNFSLHN